MVPTQLDRSDFVRPDASWLVVVFTSDTCATCADVARKVEVLESAEVAVETVSFQRDRDRHERYEIDSVPMLVIAGADGAIRFGVLGPVTATDLWAAMADLRAGGSGDIGCSSH